MKNKYHLHEIQDGEKEEAFDEFHRLRNDDKDFEEQWGENDFQEWYEDVYKPSVIIPY